MSTSGTGRIWRGRADVRAVVYVAALVAVRHNPEIKASFNPSTAKLLERYASKL